MRSHRGWRACAILAIVLWVGAAGCGEDDGIGKRYPVSGTVTYKGQPVPKATVVFSPADAQTGRPATSTTDSDGVYQLTTASPGDGALPGKYAVTVSAIERDLSKTKNAAGGMYRADIILKAPKKLMVPAKYGERKSSTLTVEVKPERNTFDFPLED